MRAKKKTGSEPFGDMSDLEILAFCTDPEALATMLIVERKTLRAENARLRAVIRVNALRWAPHLSHAEIDAIVAAAPGVKP